VSHSTRNGFFSDQVAAYTIKDECLMRKMEPLTLEDREERACFARMAQPEMQEGDFWISALRQIGDRVWCLQENFLKPMDINATNLQVEEMNEQPEDLKCLHVSNLTGETVVLKEGSCAAYIQRTFACKVRILSLTTCKIGDKFAIVCR